MQSSAAKPGDWGSLRLRLGNAHQYEHDQQPILTSGITLRNNFTGGSVTVKITSSATTLGPAGVHCRAKLRTISATIRARSSSQKKNSA
jgi:hypothetical protein